ncbi:hypothetical protein NDN08_006291 [Rhodosorus marinus]|uniref:Uncharacterized protein n=1 Tax=Rhodosorus marinus TaxID=101924 RepID=A0AAV8UKD1_9RHOD|nr:hypothetical protein NDN08_006291 [Rhodosorus marinus]
MENSKSHKAQDPSVLRGAAYGSCAGVLTGIANAIMMYRNPKLPNPDIAKTKWQRLWAFLMVEIIARGARGLVGGAGYVAALNKANHLRPSAPLRENSAIAGSVAGFGIVALFSRGYALQLATTAMASAATLGALGYGGGYAQEQMYRRQTSVKRFERGGTFMDGGWVDGSDMRKKRYRLDYLNPDKSNRGEGEG